jgi:hypothetical protein
MLGCGFWFMRLFQPGTGEFRSVRQLSVDFHGFKPISFYRRSMPA